MRVTIHHIEKGPAEMYPVDAQAATGSHPLEWSRVPWTDEAKAEAMPKLKEKREADRKQRHAEAQERADALTPYDPDGFKAVGPMAGQTQQAPAGGTATDPLSPPYAGDNAGGDGNGQQMADDELTALEKQADEQSKALNAAEREFDAARERNDDKAARKAQDKVDGLRKSLAETNEKIDAKLAAV